MKFDTLQRFRIFKVTGINTDNFALLVIETPDTDQIGINITFVVIITAVILAALLGGVALALSLGARIYVANLIGARYLRETYRVGQRIRIGDWEGRVLEFTATAIVLETTAGRMTIPGKAFNELPSVLLVETSADERG